MKDYYSSNEPFLDEGNWNVIKNLEDLKLRKIQVIIYK